MCRLSPSQQLPNHIWPHAVPPLRVTGGDQDDLQAPVPRVCAHLPLTLQAREPGVGSGEQVGKEGNTMCRLGRMLSRAQPWWAVRPERAAALDHPFLWTHHTVNPIVAGGEPRRGGTPQHLLQALHLLHHGEATMAFTCPRCVLRMRALAAPAADACLDPHTSASVLPPHFCCSTTSWWMRRSWSPSRSS